MGNAAECCKSCGGGTTVPTKVAMIRSFGGQFKLFMPMEGKPAKDHDPPSLCPPKVGGSLGSTLAMRIGAIVDLTVGPILEKLTFRAGFSRIGQLYKNRRFEGIRPEF